MSGKDMAVARLALALAVMAPAPRAQEEESLGDTFKALRQERKEEHLPGRFAYAKAELVKAGAKVWVKDYETMNVRVPGEKKDRKFWPYNGWFTGPGQARGIHRLLAIVRAAQGRKA